jgi:hypothetical protein
MVAERQSYYYLEKERMSDLKTDLKALIADWDKIATQNYVHSSELDLIYFFQGKVGDMFESKRLEGKAAGYNSAKNALTYLLEKYDFTRQS